MRIFRRWTVSFKHRTILRDVGFSNIYFTKDLSFEERLEQKKLREELNSKGKDTNKIFRGKVIPRDMHIQDWKKLKYVEAGWQWA